MSLRTKSKVKVIIYTLVCILCLLGSVIYLQRLHQDYKKKDNELHRALQEEAYKMGLKQGYGVGYQKGGIQMGREMIQYFYSSCMKSKKFWIAVQTKKGVKQQGFSCYEKREL